MWWRVLIPTWRFFDAVGDFPELLLKVNGRWQNANPRPRFSWYSLFFNPAGGLYHARNNLLERLLQEIAAGGDSEKLESFALVRELAGAHEFKITVNGESVLHSAGIPA